MAKLLEKEMHEGSVVVERDVRIPTPHEKAEPLVPGEIAEFAIEILPAAWVFKKGHRIRVDISNADSAAQDAPWIHHYGIRMGSDTNTLTRPGPVACCCRSLRQTPGSVSPRPPGPVACPAQPPPKVSRPWSKAWLARPACHAIRSSSTFLPPIRQGRCCSVSPRPMRSRT